MDGDSLSHKHRLSVVPLEENRALIWYFISHVSSWSEVNDEVSNFPDN